MSDFDKATITGLVLAVILAALALAVVVFGPSVCTETVGYSRCDLGAKVSVENDRVICRCPSEVPDGR